MVIFRLGFKPGLHLLGFMHGQIVRDDVQMVVAEGAVELLEEGQEGGCVVGFDRCCGYHSGMHGKGGHEGHGTIALVGCRHALGRARPKWEYRLCAVQCLYLGFLVHAQHDGVRWRVHIQTDDGEHLGLEFRVRTFPAPVLGLVRFPDQRA
ncbi:MAG: hypothetical protein IPP83_12155 [Flavobacteriales bacterium]|nr:hypothetical protein [Flavobacteriales bacterium]